MNPVDEPPASIVFGRFRVVPHRRELLTQGELLKLGGRAFDVLMTLIDARGAIVSKDALMARVWPNRIVEENNLQSQIVALRKAFGPDRDLIRTVSGRGYQFTGEIGVPPASADERAGAGAVGMEPKSTGPETNLPEPVSRLIGRDEEISEIVNLVAGHRLVTLTGAGGIGKTRLALALARELLPHFADGVWLAEFSPIADPGLVPATVAAAVGLDLGGGDASTQTVAQALANQQLLLVLDTCEHVIDAASALAEIVLRAGSAVHVIATSREPLRAEGEWIYPVQALSVPVADAVADDDPLQYGAVRLFIERAQAAQPHFAPDRRFVAIIAAICRRLDGIPLAIELAAARAAALGIEQLATRLDDRFHLLTAGRRTALPRHQTLRATLDWSYQLLPEDERVVLHRLAIFAGPFALEAATSVVASPEIAPPQVVDGVASLVAKSLLAATVDGSTARYRLLDTTRAYALEKLVESGELQTVARRHAEFYSDLFERAEAEWEARPTAEWLAHYGWRINNLRAALDWAFSPDGDTSTGMALTAAAVPLWMHLSLMDECRSRVEQALAVFDAEPSRDEPRGMKLYTALATSLTYTGGTPPELEAAWTKTLELAERLDDTEYRLRAVWELWTLNRASRWRRAALTQAQRFCALASNRADPNHRLVGERMLGITRHYLGDQVSARRHLEGVLDEYVETENRSHIVRFQVDLRVSARTFLAPSLWLLGYPDQAMRAAEAAIEEARAANHALSVCHALVFGACPTALLAGDLTSGEHYASMLIDHSARHGLARWHAYGCGYQGALVIKRGDIAAGLQLLRAGFDELGGFATLRFMDFLMPEALCRAGEVAEGLATVDEAIARSEETEEHRFIAELLRIKGELLLLQGRPEAPTTAEDLFRQALDWARRQETLSWELRCVTSLARLLSDQGRSAEALALLHPVYNRFTEGFATADLRAAKALLDGLL
jgi:predicted ATPase/DNA-binding winged helix-turn-helix (wHTH) protein